MKTDRESYYFRHYSDSRNDPKIIRLLIKHGMEGYGVFWSILEMLRTAKFYQIEYDPEVIAHQLSINCDTIKSICEHCGIFNINEGNITHLALKDFLIKRSETYRRNRKPSIKEHNCTTIDNQLSDKARIVKESKGKESKGKNTLCLSDEEFIAKLRILPAYTHIDINNELSKMDAWLLSNPKRKKTHKFVTNWLNRIEKPMEIQQPQRRML